MELKGEYTNKLDKKEYDKQRYIIKGNEIRKQQRKHYEKHPEVKQRYREEHKEEINEYCKEWRIRHPNWSKVYYKNHIEERRERARKKDSRRHREMGFNPLNECFKGSEAHHINKNDIIYIPEKTHQSFSHCLKTGKNMKIINNYAFAYLEGVA